MSVFERALAVTQNNVTNVSTPGYAKQTPTFEALRFDPSVGSVGGVRPGPLESARDAYAEQSVRDQQSAAGRYQQAASDLAQVEPIFDPGAKSGVSAALNDLFQSFSSLTINPNDAVSRQTVLDRARQVAEAFHQAADSLLQAGSRAAAATRTTVDDVNRIATQIAAINAERRSNAGATADPGLDAQLHSDLEQLAHLVNFTALSQPDGSVSVYLGGQTAVVIGDRVFPVKVDSSTGSTAILDASGQAITGSITGGQLSSLLNTSNTTIPSYLGELNTLAQGVADHVNQTLAGGVDATGAAPSANLFTYDPVAGAASTLAVTPLQPGQLAAALPSAKGGNGNALNLAALGSATTMGAYTFAQFFGNLSAQVGRDSAAAQENQQMHELLLTQARTLRDRSSGVSLDEEATRLIEFQRAYEANARLFTALNSLTETTINLLK